MQDECLDCSALTLCSMTKTQGLSQKYVVSSVRTGLRRQGAETDLAQRQRPMSQVAS